MMSFLLEHGLELIHWVFVAFVSVFYKPRSAYWARWRWTTIGLGAAGAATLAAAVTWRLLGDQISFPHYVMFLFGCLLLFAYWSGGIIYYLFHKEVDAS